MNKLNVIGVDLAKNVIQISVVSPLNRELRNRALSRRKFAEFLGSQRPSLVAFEACATSHYWARVAQRHGHQVKIIPAKAVAPLKTVEQQGMQAIQRSRELLVHERVALSNHLRGLLMEFGIVIPQGFTALYRQLPEILENGENELPDQYRPRLNLLYGRLCNLREDLEQLNDELKVLVQQWWQGQPGRHQQARCQPALARHSDPGCTCLRVSHERTQDDQGPMAVGHHRAQRQV